MNNSSFRERFLARRKAVLQKIAELESSLALHKALLSELDAILDERGSPQTVQEETPSPTPSRRERPRPQDLPKKPARTREPSRGLSVAKAVSEAIHQMKGDFTIADIFHAICEIDEKMDAPRIKLAVTNEVSKIYRHGGIIERVRRGVYRRVEEASSVEGSET